MSKPFRVVAHMIAALALCGCMVGPDYVKPKFDAPAQYKELPPHKIAQPRDDVPREHWWEIYGDARLNALEQDVAAANPTLAAAEANYRQAQAAVRVARGGLFPGVTANVGAARAQTPGRGTGNAFTLGLTADWELDLWGRIRRGVESSQASAQASAADLESTRLSLQSELALDYLSMRIADAEKRVLDETVAAYERSLTLTQNRYNAGVVARADVVQAETQLLAAKVSQVDVTTGRAQFEHAIAILTGRPPSELTIEPSEGGAVPALPDIPVSVPSELLERRPDVAAAERRVAAANAQIGVATAAIYPTLSLSGTGGFAGSSFANWISLPNRFWSLGASLGATIFDAGIHIAQRDEAIAAYDASVANYRQTVLGAFQDVENALSTLRILEDEARVQDEALRSARLSVDLTLNQYRAGIVGFLNVVTVQAVALASERNSVELTGRRIAAHIALIKALGGGFEASQIARAP
jgi:NodT family efflux transporter outer membrane factor (OMF) lipoprotein